MRYCRKCRQVVPAPEQPACPACDAVLVGLDQLSDEELDQPVVLTWCKDMVEAEMLKAALGGLDIYAVVENEALISCFSGYDFRGAAADTRVLVRLRDAEAAIDFLRRKDSGELGITVDDAPDDSAGPDEPGNA